LEQQVESKEVAQLAVLPLHGPVLANMMCATKMALARHSHAELN